MIKVIALLKAKSGISQEEFIEYWKNVHGRVAEQGPGFQKYMQRYVHNYPIKGVSPENGYAGVVECWFNSVEDMQKCTDNDYYRDIIYPDEEKFIDWSNPIAFIVEENTFYDRAEK